MNVILPRIEWEGLQEKQIISKIVVPSLFTKTVEKIEIQRDENYNINAKLKSKYNTFIEDPAPKVKAGELVDLFDVEGTDLQEA